MSSVMPKHWIAIVALLGVLTTSCSSGNDSDSADPPSGPTSSEAPAAPDEPDAPDETAADEPTDPADETAADEPTDPADETAADEPTDPADEVRRVLRIGYAYPDVSAFAILSDKFSIGDPEVQAASVLQAWRRDGVLPLDGIDIELVFGKYNILDSEEKLGVCTQFAEDEEVFAVIAGRNFEVGSECLASRYGIPVIDASGLPRSTYDRTSPWLFTVRADESRVMELFVAWADRMGALDGKRIGVFWDTRSEEAVDSLKAALAEIGQEVASDLPSDGEGIGSPQDAIVVQRFLADDVDFVILLVSTSSVTNYLASAEEQGFHPDLLWFEWANTLTDVSTAAYPQGLIDGVQAMTMGRLGEIAAGMELAPQAVACIEDYEAFSGEDVALVSPESGETVQTLFTCDLMSLLLEGLEGAGADPTPESFVASLETITDFPLATWGNLTWTPDDHAGVEQVRTVVWSTACECWTAQGEFEDLG